VTNENSDTVSVINTTNNTVYETVNVGSNPVAFGQFISGKNPTTVPDAHFRIDPTTGPVPLTVQFTDKTTGEPTSWYWDFGDGTTSTLQNPVHTYNTAGIYIPILTASNVVGTSTKISTVPITVT
jgi:YVTN family beta-propeller protein